MATPKKEVKKRKYETLFGSCNAQIYKEKDLPIMAQKIQEYFNMCDDEKRPYTMCGLANYLGIHKDTLVDYGHREPFSYLIKNAKQVIEQSLEENLYRLGNNSGIIFNLKNNYGWKDQQEIKTTSDVNISPLESAVEKLIESTHD